MNAGSPSSRAWIEIDLGAFSHNLAAVRSAIGAGRGVWAVVKADAYGHGIEPVAAALDAAGIDGFAVIGLDEAIRVREASDRPVLVMGYLADAEFAEAVSRGFHLSLYDAGLLPLIEAAARVAGTAAHVHLKVESGLNRLGVPPEDCPALLQAIAASRHMELFGMFSHLASSADRQENLRQLDRFQSAIDGARAMGLQPKIHMTKSHALMPFPEGWFDFVRVGLAIYGFEEVVPGLRPAMSAHTVVMQRKKLARGEGVSYGHVFVADRDMEIAVIAMGYNEGLSLSMSEKIDVLVNGHRARQLGRICMNLTVIDVTGIPAERGDAVVVLGSQGVQEITACEIAERTGLRQHEIVTRIGRSLPKRYLAAPSPATEPALAAD